MNMARLLKSVVLLVLAMSLVACGFELRRELTLPPALTTLRLDVADPFSPLERDLAAALERSGASITERAEAPRVSIPVNVLSTQVQSIGDAARVTEYVVRYRVEMLVLAQDGTELLPLTVIELDRDFTYDETQALGAAAEEELLRKELQREMVREILRRISLIG